MMVRTMRKIKSSIRMDSGERELLFPWWSGKASWRRWYFIRVMGKGLNYGLSRERAPQEEGPGNAEFLRGECPQQEPSVTGAE